MERRAGCLASGARPAAPRALHLPRLRRSAPPRWGPRDGQSWGPRDRQSTPHACAAARLPAGARVLWSLCVGGLLQTDPQERAKTTTASSGCRPRPTAPDPGLSHGNSQEQATLGLTNAVEATGTPHRSARNIEAREQVEHRDYLEARKQGKHRDYLDVVSDPSLIEAIIRPS